MARGSHRQDQKRRRKRKPPGPSRVELEQRIKALMKVEGAFVWDEPHFAKRMRQRGVLMREVLECLAHGSADGEPEPDIGGEWRIFMVRVVLGRRLKVRVAVSTHTVTGITLW